SCGRGRRRRDLYRARGVPAHHPQGDPARRVVPQLHHSEAALTMLLRSTVLLCALALTGCALKDMPPHEETAKQAMPNVAPPPQGAAGAEAGPIANKGLVSLNDPRLDALVREALAYNADVRIAAARVDVAAAYFAGAKSPLWPQVNLVARGGGKMSGDSSGLSGVGLFAAWEIDLWGRVRSTARATELQYESAQLDAEYARQSIAALVVKGWILAV